MAVVGARWHQKDVGPDLLRDAEQDLEVAVAEVGEGLDDGGQVSETDLLRGFRAVWREDLVDDLEEFGNLLLRFFLRIGLVDLSKLRLVFLAAFGQLCLLIAELLESAVAEDE